jgi:hypothetical protein
MPKIWLASGVPPVSVTAIAAYAGAESPVAAIVSAVAINTRRITISLPLPLKGVHRLLPLSVDAGPQLTSVAVYNFEATTE